MEEKIKTKFEKNMSKILYLQLAFEDYSLHSGNEPELYIKINEETQQLREQKDQIDEKTKIEKSLDILNQYEELLKIVGKEKFIFYEDGSIEYKWDDNLLKGEK